MPVPKRRHSKARGRKRRAQWKLESPNLSPCPNCKKPKLPHRICPHCGFYKEREVIPPRPEKEE
jgi:large subunit ribosomal protein L32